MLEGELAEEALGPKRMSSLRGLRRWGADCWGSGWVEGLGSELLELC